MNPQTNDTPSYPAITRFFAPLALQSASQGLTYPLVAMVASRGEGGPLNLAGLAQSHMVMFLLGTLGFGLVATGMVFGRDREGFAQFRKVTLLLAFIAVTIQALLCIPAAASFLFEGIIGLPPSIAYPAQITLLASVPLQLLFFMRIPYQVSMYNGMAAGRASLATIMRIVITAVLAPLFCFFGAVGPLWAIVCLTLPVILEVGASALLAAPYLKKLESANAPPPSKKELVRFNLPLSISGYFLALSAMVLGAFIARAADPERMLPAYYLALGLATPVAFGATRIQEVVLAFHPREGNDHRTLTFAVAAGFVLGLLPLVFVLPGLSTFYYVNLQNLAAADLGIVRVTALALVAFPICVAVRAQGEGLAAQARKPMTVIIAQAAYLTIVLVTAAIALWLGVAGNLIGALALGFGNLSSTITLRLLLDRIKRHDHPVPATTTFHGQIR